MATNAWQSYEKYDSKERFISYWYQIEELIKKVKQGPVLEIGVGNRFVSDYLKKRGLNVTTLDLDVSLKPDCGGSVLHIPFAEEAFFTVAGFELLEHIPYKDFKNALEEMRRTAKKNVLISLPDTTRFFKLSLFLPRIGEKRMSLSLPYIPPREHKYDGEHFWEIGKRRYSLKRILKDIQSVGFKTIKTYRLFEFHYHRFFILSK